MAAGRREDINKPIGTHAASSKATRQTLGTTAPVPAIIACHGERRDRA